MWLRGRLRRLLVPVVPLLLTWLVAVSVATAAGVPGPTLRTASQIALVPTWFLAAYVVVCAVAPATLWLWERWGWATVVGGLALGGLVDLVSIGTGSLAVGFANYLVVWATVHQLGYAWLDGRLGGTGRRLGLAAVGLAGTVALVWFGPYPVSMIGLDGAVVNNSYPTRVTLGFLGLLQAGVVLALEPVLARWLARERPWRATVLVNARIMTIYLWHLTAMVGVIGLSLLLGGFGLGAEPLSGAWWAGRPVWWAVLAAVTVGLVALLGRFETARPLDTDAVPVWLPVGVALLACGGLGSMAGQGIVGADGVHWWWPVLVVGAVSLLRWKPGGGDVRADAALSRRAGRHPCQPAVRPSRRRRRWSRSTSLPHRAIASSSAARAASSSPSRARSSPRTAGTRWLPGSRASSPSRAARPAARAVALGQRHGRSQPGRR